MLCIVIYVVNPRHENWTYHSTLTQHGVFAIRPARLSCGCFKFMPSISVFT